MMSVGIDKAAENWVTGMVTRLVVQRVYRTMKAEAPVYSGELKKSIRIDKIGKYHWRIAPHTDHDWYAEYGNHANSADGKIHPTHAKAMPITKRGDPTKKAVAFVKAVRPYKGSRFVEKTAKKFK